VEFYATAAQVIPTLFIAMAFSGGILAEKADRTQDISTTDRVAVASLYATTVMIFGEICAFLALATNGSVWTGIGVWAGLIAGLAGVALPVVRTNWWRTSLFGRVLRTIFVVPLLVLGLVGIAAFHLITAIRK